MEILEQFSLGTVTHSHEETENSHRLYTEIKFDSYLEQPERNFRHTCEVLKTDAEGYSEAQIKESMLVRASQVIVEWLAKTLESTEHETS